MKYKTPIIFFILLVSVTFSIASPPQLQQEIYDRTTLVSNTDVCGGQFGCEAVYLFDSSGLISNNITISMSQKRFNTFYKNERGEIFDPKLNTKVEIGYRTFVNGTIVIIYKTITDSIVIVPGINYFRISANKPYDMFVDWNTNVTYRIQNQDVNYITPWGPWGPISNKTMLHYSFNTSLLIDDSGHGLTLTNVGNVLSRPGKLYNSSLFSGRNRLERDINWIPTNFTISMWVNVTTLLKAGTFIAEGATSFTEPRIGMFHWKSGRIGCWSGGGGAGTNLSSSGTVITVNKWHHIVCTRWSNGTTTLYVDGSPVISGSMTAPSSPSEPMYIGMRKAAASQGQTNYTGFIDEITLINRTWDKSYVLEVYNNGSGCIWPFANDCIIQSTPVMRNVTIVKSGTTQLRISANATDADGDKITNWYYQIYRNGTLYSSNNKSGSYTQGILHNFFNYTVTESGNYSVGVKAFSGLNSSWLNSTYYLVYNLTQPNNQSNATGITVVIDLTFFTQNLWIIFLMILSIFFYMFGLYRNQKVLIMLGAVICVITLLLGMFYRMHWAVLLIIAMVGCVMAFTDTN